MREPFPFRFRRHGVECLRPRGIFRVAKSDKICSRRSSEGTFFGTEAGRSEMTFGGFGFRGVGFERAGIGRFLE
jgi:hypothetical protein